MVRVLARRYCRLLRRRRVWLLINSLLWANSLNRGRWLMLLLVWVGRRLWRYCRRVRFWLRMLRLYLGTFNPSRVTLLSVIWISWWVTRLASRLWRVSWLMLVCARILRLLMGELVHCWLLVLLRVTFVLCRLCWVLMLMLLIRSLVWHWLASLRCSCSWWEYWLSGV